MLRNGWSAYVEFVRNCIKSQWFFGKKVYNLSPVWVGDCLEHISSCVGWHNAEVNPYANIYVSIWLRKFFFQIIFFDREYYRGK